MSIKLVNTTPSYFPSLKPSPKPLDQNEQSTNVVGVKNLKQTKLQTQPKMGDIKINMAQLNSIPTKGGRLADLVANQLLHTDGSQGYGGNGCMAAVSSVLRRLDSSIPNFTHTQNFIDFAQKNSQKFAVQKTTIGKFEANSLKPGDIIVLGNADNQHALIAAELPDYWGGNRNPKTLGLYGNTGGKYNAGKEFVPGLGEHRQMKGSHLRLQEVADQRYNNTNDGKTIINQGALNSGKHPRYKTGEVMYIIRLK
jgi:hypothetical protein